MKKTTIIIILMALGISTSQLFASGPGKGTISRSRVKFIEGKQKEVVLNSISRKAKKYKFDDVNYYYDEGNFFVQNDDKNYVLVRPPKGLKVKEIYEGYERIIRSGYVVYYLNGAFYYQRPKEKGFYVVNGPVGSIITKIPESSAKIEIGGKSYLLYFNAVFKATPTRRRDLYTLSGYLDK